MNIPKQSIEWLVARMHVGALNAEVRAHIAKYCSGDGWTPAKVKEAGNYAVRCHNKNRKLYCNVVLGRV